MTSLGLLVNSISHGIKGMLTGLDDGIYLVNSGSCPKMALGACKTVEKESPN